MTGSIGRDLLRGGARKISKHGLQIAFFLVVIVVLVSLNGLKRVTQETRRTGGENQPLFFSRYLLSKENDAADNRVC